MRYRAYDNDLHRYLEAELVREHIELAVADDGTFEIYTPFDIVIEEVSNSA